MNSDVQWCTVHVSSTVQCMYSVVQCLYSVYQSYTGHFLECQKYLRLVVSLLHLAVFAIKICWTILRVYFFYKVYNIFEFTCSESGIFEWNIVEKKAM